jgi:hypothetical protein
MVDSHGIQCLHTQGGGWEEGEVGQESVLGYTPLEWRSCVSVLGYKANTGSGLVCKEHCTFCSSKIVMLSNCSLALEPPETELRARTFEGPVIELRARARDRVVCGSGAMYLDLENTGW